MFINSISSIIYFSFYYYIYIGTSRTSMQAERFDYAIKFIIVGDVGVGKTSLISRFITGQYNPHHEYTVGI